MPYFLGIDLGTSGVKAVLVDEEGTVTASAGVEYPLLTPRPNWAEQEPESWWEAAVKATRETLKRAREDGPGPPVAAVGLTGQMHGSVFLDRRGRVIRPAILWCDQRTEGECREIEETVGLERLIRLTSNRALAGFTAPKILWLRRHEPELYRQLKTVLLPKDYIRYRLTGAMATEVSDASGTLLFDVARRKWSEEMLQALELPASLLPECFESPQVTGTLIEESASCLGLQPGTPVVGGAGDQAAGAVGSGIVSPGTASCVIGTSGVIFWPTGEPVFDPRGRLHSFCHAVPGRWHLMGVTLSAGGSLRWYRDTFAEEEIRAAGRRGVDPYELILESASTVLPGAEGLLFLPYLTGERTPYPDANARGAFLGLSLRHRRAHLARAVLEGVAFSLKDCLELGRQCGIKTGRVYLSGGGARSPLWREIITDILKVETARPLVEEGPAYGAALLAAVGVGRYSSVEAACQEVLRYGESRKPHPRRAALYQELYEIYRPLYARLKEFHDSAAQFAESAYLREGES